MAEVHGTCDKRFDAVRVALAESLDDADVGASAAVFVDGEPVADLWGGYKDAKKTEPWEEDTITNVWSTHQDDGGAERADPRRPRRPGP